MMGIIFSDRLPDIGGVGHRLNDMCFAWVIQVDPYCCNEEWDSVCQETFDYCSVSGVDIMESEDLIIYPNPVLDKLSINKNVDLDVFNSVGSMITSKQNINVLDVSLWTPGMYVLRITYNNRVVIKRIIK